MEKSSCPAFRVCSSADDCWDNSQSTADCWTTVWILIGVGAVLILYGEICLDRDAPLELLIRWWIGRRMKSGEKVEVEERARAFVETVREEKDFIKDYGADFLSAKGGAAYVPKQYSANTYAFSLVGLSKSFKYIGVTYIHTILVSSLGWGMISSSGSTILWLITAHDEFCFDQGFSQDQPGPNAIYIQDLSDKFRILYGQYIFLPIFLLSSYIGYVAWRWREFQINCNIIEGAAKDIAMLCGAAVTTPATLDERKALFRIYRYLNCAHAMTYKTVSPTIGPLSYDGDFIRMGLLTGDEVKRLLPTEERHGVFGLLADEIYTLMKDKSGGVLGTTLAALRVCRAQMDGHMDRLSRDQPNTFLDLMVVMSTLWIILIVVGEAFTLFMYAGGDLLMSTQPCFQPLVIFGVFTLTGVVRVAFVLIYILRNPFGSKKVDAIKVDNYLAGVERSTFVLFRTSFAPEAEHEVESAIDEAGT